MFRSKPKPNLEQVTRLRTEIQKGREAFSRRLPGTTGDIHKDPADEVQRRTGRLYEVFTAYGAPIGRV